MNRIKINISGRTLGSVVFIGKVLELYLIFKSQIQFFLLLDFFLASLFHHTGRKSREEGKGCFPKNFLGRVKISGGVQPFVMYFIFIKSFFKQSGGSCFMPISHLVCFYVSLSFIVYPGFVSF